MHIRDICEYELGSIDKAEEFALWAFGEEFRHIYPKDLLNKWNELHGDLLIIYSDGNPFKDIREMIDIWEKEKQPDS